MREILRKYIRQVLKEEFNNSALADSIIKRIPFLEDYNIKRIPNNGIIAQRIVYNRNYEFKLGEEIHLFPNFNIGSEFSFSNFPVRDNVFYNFILKNEFFISKPEDMDSFNFKVLTTILKRLEQNYSYRKEIIVKEGQTIKKEDLDNVINDINKKLFEFEEFMNKNGISFYNQKAI